MARVIAFSGLDGSGKSTQINLIVDLFENKNKKIYKFWARGGYTPGFQKLKNILRLIFKKSLPKPGKSKSRKKALKNSFVRNFWLYLSIVDLIIFYGIYLRVKYFFGYNIIFDRHIIDTEIDFKLAYPDLKFEKWIVWKLLNFISLKPDYHFVLLISVDESLRRSKLKHEPFPDSREVLNERLINYENKILEIKNLKRIWCEESLEAISNKIVKTFVH